MSGRVDAAELRRARRDGRAIVGFNVYNLEQGMAVVRAAESVGVPTLLQAGSSAFRYAGREPLAQLALALAAGASVDVGVHLDHATDLDEITRCLEAGYSSVMYDGSALPYEENLVRTRAVVRRAHATGAWVEAELAGIAGDEDVSGAVAVAGELTDPGVAERFVEETGVDALAVAVGNVHGIPSAPVELDLERLAQIAERVEVPLVLHGASGLPDRQVQDAIALGVAKLNVNTELRRAFRDGLLTMAVAGPRDDAIATLLQDATDETQAAAEEKLQAFTAPPGATTTTREAM